MTPLTAVQLVFHLLLSAVLFRLVNWLGANSKAFGYVSLRPVPAISGESATAFNVILRVGVPVVFVILVSAGLYAVGLDALVRGIWRVPVIYFAYRIGLNVLLGRALVMNWFREIGQAAASIGIVGLLYSPILSNKSTLLPSAATIADELWIAAGLFVYAILNNLRVGERGAEQRSDRYINHAYARYCAQYGAIVREADALGAPPSAFVESVVYAVMIYEGFNRPPHIQQLERFLQKLRPGVPRTLGPMQVRSPIPMTNSESVRAGVQRIRGVVEHERKVTGDDMDPSLYSIADEVYRSYNPDEAYMEEVASVHEVLVRKHYPSLNLDGSEGKLFSDVLVGNDGDMQSIV